MGEDINTIGKGQKTERVAQRIERPRFSPFGETFDNGTAYRQRVSARDAMNAAKTPKLYGTTTIDFGGQGTASVRRVGTERKGTLQTILTQNGKPMPIGDVQYNEEGGGMFKKSANDAFKEVKRRLGGYVRV